jgi:Ran GTPase-activating protein (RanGAP) involved in mRNA processing and transport
VVKELRIHENSIRDKGANAFAAVLRTNATLQVLVLDDNFIGTEGAVAMAEALTINLALMTLKMGGANNFDQDSKSKLRDAAKGRRSRLQLIF